MIKSARYHDAPLVSIYVKQVNIKYIQGEVASILTTDTHPSESDIMVPVWKITLNFNLYFKLTKIWLYHGMSVFPLECVWLKINQEESVTYQPSGWQNGVACQQRLHKALKGNHFCLVLKRSTYLSLKNLFGWQLPPQRD